MCVKDAAKTIKEGREGSITDGARRAMPGGEAQRSRKAILPEEVCYNIFLKSEKKKTVCLVVAKGVGEK